MNRGYSGVPEPYSDFWRRQEDHEAEEARQRAHLERENQRARLERVAQLDTERAAQRRAAEEALEAKLAPARERLQREWLIAHPALTAKDFASKAWPLLRKNLLEDQAEQQVAAFKRGAGGVNYSF